MSPPKQPQIQNLPNFLIENTNPTGFIEAFHSSPAQSAGELWLKVLGKNLAPKFCLTRDLKCRSRKTHWILFKRNLLFSTAAPFPPHQARSSRNQTYYKCGNSSGDVSNVLSQLWWTSAVWKVKI